VSTTILYGVRDTRRPRGQRLIHDCFELFFDRRDAEAVVAKWDDSGGDLHGVLEVVEIPVDLPRVLT
jgi:hypothetical protein